MDPILATLKNYIFPKEIPPIGATVRVLARPVDKKQAQKVLLLEAQVIRRVFTRDIKESTVFPAILLSGAADGELGIYFNTDDETWHLRTEDADDDAYVVEVICLSVS